MSQGGWKPKYLIRKVKPCERCEGTGEVPRACGCRSAGECMDIHMFSTERCYKCRGKGYTTTAVDSKAVYFVLRLDEDPHARIAAEAYAESVRNENPQLASDIIAKLKEDTPCE